MEISVSGREPTVEHGTIQHFCRVVEDLYFVLFTGQKPIVHSLHTELDRYCPRDLINLDYIFQLTKNIQIQDKFSCVADTLSSPQFGVVSVSILYIPNTALSETQDKSYIEVYCSPKLQYY